MLWRVQLVEIIAIEICLHFRVVQFVQVFAYSFFIFPFGVVHVVVVEIVAFYIWHKWRFHPSFFQRFEVEPREPSMTF